jgi:hypothetical protein
MSEQLSESIPGDVSVHPAWIRLEEQRKWYSSESKRNKQYYHRIKIAQIILASAIPLVALINAPWSHWVTALAGSAIAVLEAIHQLKQYSQLWIEYRSAAEKLKRDKTLFLAEAGPYKGLDVKNRLILLAERIEDYLSAEHENWVAGARQVLENRADKASPAAPPQGIEPHVKPS